MVAAGASHHAGSDGEHDVGGRDEKPAADGEADLAEPVDKKLDQGGVDQPADAEAGDGQADQREAQAEAQAQVSADIGEGAPHQRALDEGGEMTMRANGLLSTDGVIGDEAARATSPACGEGGGTDGRACASADW